MVRQETGRPLLVVVQPGRGFGGDLLDRYSFRAVDVIVRTVKEEKGQNFGGIPGEVFGAAGNGFRLPQTFAIVGVGVFEFRRFAFDRDQVPGLVIAVGRRRAAFGARFGALAEFVEAVATGCRRPRIK